MIIALWWYARSRARDQVMLLLLLMMMMISSLTLSHFVVIVCLFCPFLVYHCFVFYTLTLPIALYILLYVISLLLSNSIEPIAVLSLLLLLASCSFEVFHNVPVTHRFKDYRIAMHTCSNIWWRDFKSVIKREGNIKSLMGTIFNRLKFKCYHCAYMRLSVCVCVCLPFSLSLFLCVYKLMHASELLLGWWRLLFFICCCCCGDTISHLQTVEYQFTWRSHTSISISIAPLTAHRELGGSVFFCVTCYLSLLDGWMYGYK